MIKSIDLYSTGYYPIQDTTEPADKVDVTDEVLTNIAWHRKQPERRKFNLEFHLDTWQHKTTWFVLIQTGEWEEK